MALGSTTTFTVSDKGITFTSPLRYGAAQMNTTDADGNFLSYTAVPYTQEIPDGDTNDDTQGKEDSGNTSGGTSNDSTQSGESQETVHQRAVPMRLNRTQAVRNPAHRHQAIVP